MSSISQYLANKLLGLSLCGSSFSTPTTTWCGLLTACNSNMTSFTEVATNTGYVREIIPWSVPSGRTINNSAPVTFGVATTIWGGVVALGIFDNATGGNPLWQIPVTTNTITTGQAYIAPSQNVNIILTGGITTYLSQTLLGHTLLGSTYTPPNPVYLGLLSSCNSYGDLIAEVPAGLGYVRNQIGFQTPSSQTTLNSLSVLTGPATTPWGNIPAIGVFDSNATGNLLYWSLASSQAYQTNDYASLPSSVFSISML